MTRIPIVEISKITTTTKDITKEVLLFSTTYLRFFPPLDWLSGPELSAPASQNKHRSSFTKTVEDHQQDYTINDFGRKEPRSVQCWRKCRTTIDKLVTHLTKIMQGCLSTQYKILEPRNCI